MPRSYGFELRPATEAATVSRPGKPASTPRGWSGLGVAPVALGLRLHPSQARVVVRKLVQMCAGDLPGDELVVVGHVRLGIVPPVLELDIQAHAELLDVETRRVP